MLNIEWFNVTNEQTKNQCNSLVMDAVRPTKLNPFTLTSVFMHSNALIEFNFNSELDAYKFASYCYFRKARVDRSDEHKNVYRVVMTMNDN